NPLTFDAMRLKVQGVFAFKHLGFQEILWHPQQSLPLATPPDLDKVARCIIRRRDGFVAMTLTNAEGRSRDRRVQKTRATRKSKKTRATRESKRRDHVEELYPRRLGGPQDHGFGRHHQSGDRRGSR